MSTSLKGRVARFTALLGLAVLFACGDSETSGPAGPKPVASVSVSPATSSLVVGQQVSLAAAVKDVDGKVLQRQVTWQSANETVASVTSAGVVTALASGSAVISATTDGKMGTAQIDVAIVPVAEVRLSVDEEVVLEWNASTQLGAVALDAQGNVLPGRAVQWISSKPTVVTVSADGKVEAKSSGSALIGASIEGKSAVVGVRVNPVPVAGITLEGDLSALEIGETVSIAANVTGANGQPIVRQVTWTTSAPGVATVQGSGLSLAGVTGNGVGSGAITATVEGKSATLAFSVTPRPTYDLVYSRPNGTASEIFVLGLDGSAAAPARVNAGSVSRDPSPSPDGQRLVFAVSQIDLTTGQPLNDLFIVNRNGMNMRQFTKMAGVEDQPVWSPDGTRILFHAVAGPNGPSDLWVMNADGTGLTNLTANIPNVTDKREPAWSPDGSRIAFIGAVAGQHKIWIMNADGSNPQQFTRDQGFDASPAWSAAGDRIAFSRWNVADPALGWDIMIAPLATGVPQRLALPGDQHTPVWSPDGHYIALTGTKVVGQGVMQLYTMRPDGTSLRVRTVNPAWGGGVAPSWIHR